MEEILEEDLDQSLRVHITAKMERTRIAVQVDVGFGDVVTPAPVEITFPVLIGMPAPVVWAYPRESVIAEKLEAMVSLGVANSRMKDFFDLWWMSETFSFDGKILVQAIAQTFRRRKTGFPSGIPIALSGEFGSDLAKAKQWHAFLQRSGMDENQRSLPDVLDDLIGFLLNPLGAASGNVDFESTWRPGGPWSSG